MEMYEINYNRNGNENKDAIDIWTELSAKSYDYLGTEKETVTVPNKIWDKINKLEKEIEELESNNGWTDDKYTAFCEKVEELDDLKIEYGLD